MRPRSLIVAAAIFAAACATATTTAPPGAVAPRGGPEVPSGPIDLGDWKRGGPDAVAQRFSSVIARRYGEGLALSAAVADLRANQFTCARPSAGKAGDPPAQVCRRTVTEAGCTHTWQAHLWDADAARLARVRGLYDRRCAADGGLLGGPGSP
jgi:hypothetical protein